MVYTTINVRKTDRDIVKAQKNQNETWSEFLRRSAEALESGEC